MSAGQVIAADGEMRASRALGEASGVIEQSPAALQLRYLQVLPCSRFSIRPHCYTEVPPTVRIGEILWFLCEKFCSDAELDWSGEKLDCRVPRPAGHVLHVQQEKTTWTVNFSAAIRLSQLWLSFICHRHRVIESLAAPCVYLYEKEVNVACEFFCDCSTLSLRG